MNIHLHLSFLLRETLQFETFTGNLPVIRSGVSFDIIFICLVSLLWGKGRRPALLEGKYWVFREVMYLQLDQKEDQIVMEITHDGNGRNVLQVYLM